jgi:release factor glutamine methyltransferase
MEEIFAVSKISDLLKLGTKYLENVGVPKARTEADLLLAFVLGISRVKLYLELSLEVSTKEKKIYAELLERRGNREPLAYLLKTREFMGLEFYVDSKVLIPRPETELLVEKILEMGKNKTEEQQVRVLDLCTGSGSIAVSLAYYWPSVSIVAVDISLGALAVAKKNAAKMQVEIDFREGDLFQPVQGEYFDFIVSNPPYVSEAEYCLCSPEVRQEPRLALLGGADGLDFYRRIALEGEAYLAPGGMIMLEIGHSQGLQITQLFKDKGFRTVVFPDYADLDRIVLAEKE